MATRFLADMVLIQVLSNTQITSLHSQYSSLKRLLGFLDMKVKLD